MTVIDSPQPIDNAEAAITALKKSEDNGVRYYAAWWLGKNRIREAIPLLCECLKDERDRTVLGGYPLRRQAARSLGMLKDPMAVTALIASLDCSDLRLQKMVIIALKDIGDRGAVPTLVDMLNAEKEDKPAEALIEALTAFKVWEVRDKIEPFLQHSSERVKCAAAQYLYALTLEPRYLEMLFETLGHENRFVRYAAAFDLAALSRVETVPAIIKAEIPNNIKLVTLKQILETILLDKTQTEVKRQKQSDFLFPTIDDLLLDGLEGNIHRANTEKASQEVEKIRRLVDQASETPPQVPESPISASIEAVKSPDPKVKAAAIGGLVQLAPASVDRRIQILEPSNDKNITVEAIPALGQNRTIGAIDDLIRMLSHQDPAAKAAARVALISLAPESVAPLITAFRASQERELAAQIVQILALIADDRGLEILAEVATLTVPDRHWIKVSRVAARGLGRVGSTTEDRDVSIQAVEKLTWVLRYAEDWALRYAAVVSVEEISLLGSRALLEQAIEQESDIVVKARIQLALER